MSLREPIGGGEGAALPLLREAELPAAGSEQPGARGRVLPPLSVPFLSAVCAPGVFFHSRAVASAAAMSWDSV